MTANLSAKKLCCAAMLTGGALVYPAAELVWRGRTHWSMSLAGGACALLIHLCNRRMRRRSVVLRCSVGCAIITGVEFATGCVVNRLLGWNVWDYSAAPLNLLGQICLPYCALWFFLSLPVIMASTILEHKRLSGAIVFS